jgi:hypothetical protein
MAMRGKDISNLAIELSKANTGFNAYLSSYAKAKNQIEKKLTENEHKKYKSLADKWSNNELPSGVQEQYIYGDDSSRLKLADYYTSMIRNHGTDALKEFTLTMFNQFGMQVVILGAYFNHKDSNVAISL